MEPKILVMGATGLVGGGVGRELRARGVPFRVASRSAAVPFDLTDASTFGRALEGIEKVFLIARPGDDEPHVVAAPLLSAMRAAGVRHVVNLTAFGAELRPTFGLRLLELALEGSGLAWTHLRPNWFMQIFDVPPLGPILRTTGRLALPAGDARVSFVDARDVSAVAAAALLDPGFQGRALSLTGPEALDHDAAVRAIGAAAGTTMRYHPQTEEEARAALAAAGFASARIERLIGFYRLVRSGLASPVTPDVEHALGRPPRGFRAFAADYFGGSGLRESGSS